MVSLITTGLKEGIRLRKEAKRANKKDLELEFEVERDHPHSPTAVLETAAHAKPQESNIQTDNSADIVAKHVTKNPTLPLP